MLISFYTYKMAGCFGYFRFKNTAATLVIAEYYEAEIGNNKGQKLLTLKNFGNEEKFFSDAIQKKLILIKPFQTGVRHGLN